MLFSFDRLYVLCDKKIINVRIILFRGDMTGAICEQRGVFRVNCVDCLDRTNVVQTAISRVVMETQVTY